MTTRLFIVGTDTAVGKTSVTAALLRTSIERGLPLLLPFKPAQSGDDRPSDIERLLRAARLPLTSIGEACPLRYSPPLAPGLAEDPRPFLPASDGATTTAQPLASPPQFVPPTVLTALERWEDKHKPAITLVEGAGGLHVPMPGGTWQSSWITALSELTVVVGRAGLGTINHSISTIEGLRSLGRPPLGFILSHTDDHPDPSTTDNAAVIALRTGVPHLGTLPFGPEPAIAPDLLDALLHQIPAELLPNS